MRGPAAHPRPRNFPAPNFTFDLIHVVYTSESVCCSLDCLPSLISRQNTRETVAYKRFWKRDWTTLSDRKADFRFSKMGLGKRGRNRPKKGGKSSPHCVRRKTRRKRPPPLVAAPTSPSREATLDLPAVSSSGACDRGPSDVPSAAVHVQVGSIFACIELCVCYYMYTSMKRCFVS